MSEEYTNPNEVEIPAEPKNIPMVVVLIGVLGAEELTLNGFGLGTLVLMAAGSY